MEEHDRTLVVLITSPFHGHMTPILQLATTLHAKGFNIAIAHSNLNPPHPSNLPFNFTFLPLSDNLPAMDDSGSFTNFLNDLNANCKPSFKDHLTRLMSEGNYKSIVVVYDHVMFFAPDVAVELNLVAIMLRSSSAAFIPAFLARQQVRQQTRFLEQEFVMQEVVPNHHPFRYKDLPFHNSSIEDWQKICANFSQHARPSAMVFNTVQSLEHESLIRINDYFQVPVFAVGPLHKITPSPLISLRKQDTSCVTWLDKQPPKSVVYISFGSLAKMDVKVLTEMAWGLVKSNQRFLWAIRPGLVSGSEWLELLPDGFVEETRERGLIVKWAPQKEVLSHFAVGVFWSHCGWNSCLESISSGVVMICQPWSVDQGANARYVSYVWKIGLELEHVERGEIERMIRRVMEDNEGAEMRVRVNILKKMIKEAVENGGSSQNALEGLVQFILSC